VGGYRAARLLALELEDKAEVALPLVCGRGMAGMVIHGVEAEAEDEEDEEEEAGVLVASGGRMRSRGKGEVGPLMSVLLLLLLGEAPLLGFGSWYEVSAVAVFGVEGVACSATTSGSSPDAPPPPPIRPRIILQIVCKPPPRGVATSPPWPALKFAVSSLANNVAPVTESAQRLKCTNMSLIQTTALVFGIFCTALGSSTRGGTSHRDMWLPRNCTAGSKYATISAATSAPSVPRKSPSPASTDSVETRTGGST
jgi:hypothetical protein